MHYRAVGANSGLGSDGLDIGRGVVAVGNYDPIILLLQSRYTALPMTQSHSEQDVDVPTVK